ncbi:MFS transporter [Corynebacterium sp. A21]|uniref:MFS transporter n=1 Tax=Corynebacterium sp. A21 TaxID=3457318 RepID=UPI003FD4BF0D
MDLRKTIDASRMSSYQWFIVGLAVLLNALDGYDVLAMAFTANAVSAEFGLNGGQLGLLLSSGLVGMAAGSLILGPLADKFGRRNLLLFSLLLNIAGLFLSSVAGSALELALWRILTGLGIGGILACVTVVTSEFSNGRNRGMAISIYTAGYGLGATLGGLGAAELIPTFGWRSVFLVGALVTVLATAMVAVFLPESVDFLYSRRSPGAESKLNKIAARIGHPGNYRIDLDSPADATTQSGGKQRSGLSQLLAPGVLASSLRLWAAFFIVMFGFYFANSWTPKLLVESGMTAEQGIIGGLALTLGGTFGSLLYGALTTRWNARRTLMVFMVASGVLLVLFIMSTSLPLLAFSSGVVVGMLINGCVAGMYTITPQVYAPGIRTTGVGFAIGVGRIGAIMAPMLVGFLLDSGWSPTQLYICVAVIVIAGATSLIGLRTHAQSQAATAGLTATEPAKAGAAH